MNQVAAIRFDRISRLQTTFTQPHLQFRTQTAFSDCILKLLSQKQACDTLPYVISYAMLYFK